MRLCCTGRYHAECAKQLVGSGVANSAFPIKCCFSGCSQPVGLEEIKLLLEEGEAYEEACRKIFTLYVNKHTGRVLRCYSLNCNQVGMPCPVGAHEKSSRAPAMSCGPPLHAVCLPARTALVLVSCMPWAAPPPGVQGQHGQV